jgi:hypothetical protein
MMMLPEWYAKNSEHFDPVIAQCLVYGHYREPGKHSCTRIGYFLAPHNSASVLDHYGVFTHTYDENIDTTFYTLSHLGQWFVKTFSHHFEPLRTGLMIKNQELRLEAMKKAIDEESE